MEIISWCIVAIIVLLIFQFNIVNKNGAWSYSLNIKDGAILLILVLLMLAVPITFIYVLYSIIKGLILWMI